MASYPDRIVRRSVANGIVNQFWRNVYVPELLTQYFAPMGVIRRQSIKNSLVNYVAVALGMVNVLLIYPLLLSPDELGQIRFVLETALLLATFTGLSGSLLSVRFFPEFKDDDTGHHGFMGILLLFPIAGFVLYGIGTLLGYSHLPSAFKENYAYISFVLFFVLLVNILSYYIYNFKRITIPAIFNNFLVKAGVPVLTLIFARDYITWTQLLYSLAGIYLIAFVGLVVYTKRLGQLHLKPDWSFITPELRKRMGQYMMFGILGNLGGVLAMRLDTYMVTELIDYKSTGIYTIAMTVSNVLTIPVTAIISIAGPLLSENLTNNKMEEVSNIYKKSSLNLTIAGTFLLLLIWTLIDYFFEIMPNGEVYSQGKLVVLLLGLARLTDMITSVNSQIISYSRYFRFNLVALIVVSAANIIGNMILIPRYGIYGAAYATLFSFILFNLIKTVFIYIMYKMHPITKNLLLALASGIAIYFLIDLIPGDGNPWFWAALKGFFVTVLFGAAVILLKLSTDITDLYKQLLRRIGIRQ